MRREAKQMTDKERELLTKYYNSQPVAEIERTIEHFEYEVKRANAKLEVMKAVLNERKTKQ